MAFIGNQPAESFTSFATQEFSTSATTSYTLDHAVTNENEIALFINNVRQQPGSGKAYTASSTTLTLSEATATTDTMYCIFLGRALQTVTPATNSITAAMVGNDLISGKTALGATPADTDELLISDAGTLKRVDFSHLKQANTPAFQAQRSATQSISNSTFTKIENNVELFDTDGAYDHSTNYRFTVPSGAAGKYVFGVSVNIHDTPDAGYVYSLLYKNGSKLKENIVSASRTIPTSVHTITIEDADVGDYYEAYTKQVSGGSLDLNYTYGNVFFGFKLIGV